MAEKNSKTSAKTQRGCPPTEFGGPIGVLGTIVALPILVLVLAHWANTGYLDLDFGAIFAETQTLLFDDSNDDSIHIRLDQEDLWTDCVSSVSAVTSLRSRLYASRSSTVANDDGSVVAALDESIANMADLQDIESSSTLPDFSLALSPSSPCSDGRFLGRVAPATFIDSREHPLAPIQQHGCAHSFKSPSRASCPSPRSGDPGTSCDDPSVRDDVSSND